MRMEDRFNVGEKIVVNENATEFEGEAIGFTGIIRTRRGDDNHKWGTDYEIDYDDAKSAAGFATIYDHHKLSAVIIAR